MGNRAIVMCAVLLFGAGCGGDGASGGADATATPTPDGSVADAADDSDGATPDASADAGPDAGMAPGAVADSFTVSPNTQFDTTIGAVGTLLDNDTGLNLSVVAETVTSSQGASVTITADGNFTYAVPSGVTGTDTFSYTVQNGFGSDTGTVTITVGEPIWFVDNTALSNGDGTQASPFMAVSNMLKTVATNNATIYLRTGSGPYVGAIPLGASTKLLGEGTAIPGVLAAGTRPVLSGLSGNAITLGSNNVVSGLDIGNTPNGFALAGGSGTVTIRDAAITGTGGAVSFSSAGLTLDVILDSVSRTGATGYAIDLTGAVGSFEVTGTTVIDGAASTGIRLAGTAATVTMGDIEVLNRGGLAVDINSTTGAVTLGNITVGATATTLVLGVDINAPAGPVVIGNVSVTDADRQALRVQSLASGAQVTIGDVSLMGTTYIAFDIGQCTGGTLNVGNVSIANGSTAHEVIFIRNNTDLSLTFGSTEVTAGSDAVKYANNSNATTNLGKTTLAGARGLTASNNAGGSLTLSDFAFDGRYYSISATNTDSLIFLGALPTSTSRKPSSIRIDNSGASYEGTPGWWFGAIVAGTAESGSATSIELDNMVSSFHATSITVNRAGVGISVAGSPGIAFSFGDVSLGVTTAVGTGIDISNSDGATVGINTVAINNNAGAGLLGTSAFTLDIATTTGTIASLGGAAVDLTDTTVQTGGVSGITFASLSSDTTVVSLSNVTGTVSYP